MRKLFIVSLLFVTCSLLTFAQESNNGKQLWAKSFLNEKAPKFEAEKWLTKTPDTKGKFILIDFWATWCGPCRRAIPELNAIAKKFSKELVVIGISDETEEKVKAMKEPVIEYFSAIDTKATTKTAFEVKGIPHVVLIDPQGIVRWEGFPGLKDHELTEDKVEALIKKYTKSK